MDFDAVIRWLVDRLGARVVVAAQGAAPDAGNTTLSIAGPLLRVDDGDVTLIDPRLGRVEAFAVGGATLVLLEGDFVRAATTDFGQGRSALVQAAFQDFLVTVAEAGDVPRP